MIDRRVLGAARLIDAMSSTIVADGLSVLSSSALVRANHSGLWVIWRTNGLEPRTTAFDQPPSSPAIGSISIGINVRDRQNRYLPCSASIDLPRDPSLINADQPVALVQPVELRLYPAPSTSVRPGWAAIRAHVENANAWQPSEGALIRVLKTAGNQVLARGMSDARGEPSVAVPGIPITTFSSESVQHWQLRST